MIPVKRLSILLSLFILSSSWNALSHDTDIYTATDGVVQPNLLIMFDNSGSMNDLATGEPYVPGTTYPFAYSDRPNAVYLIMWWARRGTSTETPSARLPVLRRRPLSRPKASTPARSSWEPPFAEGGAPST